MEEADLVQDNSTGQSTRSSPTPPTAQASQANQSDQSVKPLQLLLLGEASSLLGAREMRVSWSEQCSTIGDLLAQLSAQHAVPLSALMRPDFRFAHNAQLIQGDADFVRAVRLSPGDELAILPPVTGG